MKQRLVLAAVLAAAAIPLPAHAQQWLADRRLKEGMGIRVGDLELHPALGGEFGYDSNYFQTASNELSSYRIRVTPALSLSTLGQERRKEAPGEGMPPALTFRAGVYAAYNELIATKSDNSDTFSNQRHVDVGANARIDINPQRPFGADIFGDFERIGEPTSDDSIAGTNGGDDRAFDRMTFRGGAGAVWRPGGGSFEWRLGYEALLNHFEKDTFDADDNIQHSIVTRGRWKFFPRTALLYDAAYRFIRYTGSSDGVKLNDGDMVRARVGLNGLITARLALLGMVGWTSSFYDGGGQDADTILAQAELKYFVIAPHAVETASTGLSTVALGFTREVSNSYLSSFFTRNRGYLSASYFLGGVFVASAEAGLALVSFPEGIDYAAFDQKRIDARLFAEYRASNSIGINASLLFAKNMSDDLQPKAGGPVDDLDYSRWQAFIGLRWFM
ncbi:MAG TPA: outer membrane beta-barrel protein [Polyangiaceae bacterium]|nr:outer membrane beta-barrel protein [Polyangiaceae bacterium]